MHEFRRETLEWKTYRPSQVSPIRLHLRDIEGKQRVVNGLLAAVNIDDADASLADGIRERRCRLPNTGCPIEVGKAELLRCLDITTADILGVL